MCRGPGRWEEKASTQRLQNAGADLISVASPVAAEPLVLLGVPSESGMPTLGLLMLAPLSGTSAARAKHKITMITAARIGIIEYSSAICRDLFGEVLKHDGALQPCSIAHRACTTASHWQNTRHQPMLERVEPRRKNF